MFGSPVTLNFDVLDSARNNRYKENDDIRLVNMAPVGSFSIYKLTTSSEKHLEKILNAQIACLVYELKTSARNTDDLSIGFDRDRNRRQQESTNNKK